MTDPIPLFHLDDIEDGGSASFVAVLQEKRTGLLVVRQGAAVVVYVNSCPHIGAPLDFEPGRFLNAEKDLILCSTHGALFRIEDGHCVHGPCIGGHLEPVAVRVEGGRVFLA
ncbi:MAG: Rieske 2Fe-2S domain-containing protein [Alphaproteobacteria bacterium]|nr:Rieske 2Fe-2S domain-containing protein [Alphaproteobacteria bacterium]MBF0250443.1 Rieske 2Fe-2S domain-containing protein [Alphaproteobacteria bacterium]